MIETCIVLEGKVINIGTWDYKVVSFEISPEVRDEEGNLISEAVFEVRATNPLPEGAYEEEREIVEGSDGGLYPADHIMPKTPEQQHIEALQAENTDLKSRLADVELALADILTS